MATLIANVKNHNAGPNDLYIGRGSIFGNDWTHLSRARAAHRALPSAQESVFHYADWLVNGVDEHARFLRSLILNGDLQGRTLVCFCKPAPCHGDILSTLIDRAAEIKNRYDLHDPEGDGYYEFNEAVFGDMAARLDRKRDEYGARCGCKFHRFDHEVTGTMTTTSYEDPHDKDEKGNPVVHVLEADSDDEVRYQRLLGLMWNWEVQKKHNSVKGASKKTIDCWKCGNTGQVRLRSDAKGNKRYGTCFRCQGKGQQSKSDFYRNDKHDRYCSCMVRDA